MVNLSACHIVMDLMLTYNLNWIFMNRDLNIALEFYLCSFFSLFLSLSSV